MLISMPTTGPRPLSRAAPASSRRARPITASGPGGARRQYAPAGEQARADHAAQRPAAGIGAASRAARRGARDDRGAGAEAGRARVRRAPPRELRPPQAGGRLLGLDARSTVCQPVLGNPKAPATLDA